MMHKIKYLYFLILILFVSCKTNQSIIKKHVVIVVQTYEKEGELKASAMPSLRSESNLHEYSQRFEYLLINVPAIHSLDHAGIRKEIWNFYPDTIKLKRLYIKEFIQDEKLENYFKLTSEAINNKNFAIQITFTKDELMEVASKFFYCDQVFADTTIQSHVCIGLNGISEANWEKDYILLEAFCYEGIFNDFNKEPSPVDESYSFNKTEACLKYKFTSVSLDEYLLDVRKELFNRMKYDSKLRESLLSYYEQNKDNLSFRIIN